MTEKIFCIGLSKTGTSSLNVALEMLGFKAKHFSFMSYRYGKLVLDPKHVEEYDAFTDTPAANCFKYLDKTYPNSKFIYTVRDLESWLKSCEKHYRLNPFDLSLAYRHFKWVHLQMSLYGCFNFDYAKFKRAYKNHDRRIREYFKDDNRLLILNVCSGEGWEKLCPFLNKEIPKMPFPKSNVTAQKVHKVIE